MWRGHRLWWCPLPVAETNPEVVAARAKVIPVIPRAEMLAELMRLKYGIAICRSARKNDHHFDGRGGTGSSGIGPHVRDWGKSQCLGDACTAWAE